MKNLNIVAVIEGDGGYSSDPKFVPLKLTFPDFDYDSESLERIIRRTDGQAVGWSSGYPIIHKFEDNVSKMIRDSLDWSNAAEIKYEFEDTPSLWEWESTFKKARVRELEPFFAQNEHQAETYVKKCANINWIEWTEEELVVSPVYMFNYALKVCKGRLPDHLDNAMNMESFKNPDSKYVKRYFKTKRYRVRSGKSLLLQKEAV